MDPELMELESSSAGTGFETPGQQCHPIWETGRTTADGFLTAGVGSNLGKHTSPTTERVDKRAVRITTTSAPSNTGSLRARSKPQDNKIFREANKQFDPGGEGGEQPPPRNAAVMVAFSFPGGTAGPGVPVVCASCFFVCVCHSALSFNFCSFQMTTFQQAEKHERRRGSSR